MNREPQSKNRRYSRIALPKGMLVAWQAKSEREVSVVKTVGLGGLFVSTPKPASVGETVRLVLCVPNGDVRAVAVVRDSQPGKGMGLEFIAMGQNDRARLYQVLKRLIPEQIPTTAKMALARRFESSQSSELDTDSYVRVITYKRPRDRA